MAVYYIVGAVLVIHFLIGIGFLIYKINSSKPAKKPDLEKDNSIE